MNPTACPLCNHLKRRKFLAFIRSEYLEFARLQNELEAHQTKCETINSGWYKFLWPSAIVKETQP
jgi:hypothetical protein